MTDQTTLRDWFAIHAPAEPWPEFEPDMPPKPHEPPLDPVGNNGEAPTSTLKFLLIYWRRGHNDLMDTAYRQLASSLDLNSGYTGDPVEDFPEYSYWMEWWKEYREALREWEREREYRRRAQWPYHYADVMMRERDK